MHTSGYLGDYAIGQENNRCNTKDREESLKVTEMFNILITLIVSQVYIYIYIYISKHIKL